MISARRSLRGIRPQLCRSCRRLRSFDLLDLGAYPLCVPWRSTVGVYIRLMFYDSLRVPPLRRVPFGKQPQKEPKRPCPSVRPSLRSDSLPPVPLRGHAVTGHPWPTTTLPASCRESHCAKPTLGLPKGPIDQQQSKNAVRFGSKKSTAAAQCSRRLKSPMPAGRMESLRRGKPGRKPG